MTRVISRVPRPFLATGLAAGALMSTMNLCATSVMAAALHPTLAVVVSQVS